MNNNDIRSYNGELFLDILYRDLYKDLEDSYKRGQKTKEEIIREYLELIEKMHDKAQNSERKREIIKELYYDKYVIKKENLPQRLSDDNKEKIIKAQKIRLGEWIDYLTDKSTLYPMWAKYWIFREMLKLGAYNAKTDRYDKRTKTTINPFVEVNPSVIAECIENISELLGNNRQSGQQIRKKIGNVSFERMYIEYQKKLKERIKTNEGRWVKYNYGNKEDAKILAKSLDGYDTKWCTASEGWAIDQLCGGGGYPGGDFYIYYTKDENSEYKIPRIAISINGHTRIVEIRGIEKGQNLEKNLIDVLELKLKDMTSLNQNDVKKNLMIIDDLKELMLISKKTQSNIPLTPQEIMDLYTKRYGFGLEQDELVKEIMKKRNPIEDYYSIKDLGIDEKIKLIIIITMLLEDNSIWPNLSNSVFIDDEEVAKEAVRQYISVLKYVNPEIKCYKEIAMRAVRLDGLALKYVSPKVEYYKEVAQEAVHQCSYALKFINDLDLKDELMDQESKTRK